MTDLKEFVRQRIKESKERDRQDQEDIRKLKSQRHVPLIEKVRSIYPKRKKEKKIKFKPDKIFKKKIFTPTKTKIGEEVRGFVGVPRFLYGK